MSTWVAGVHEYTSACVEYMSTWVAGVHELQEAATAYSRPLARATTIGIPISASYVGAIPSKSILIISFVHVPFQTIKLGKMNCRKRPHGRTFCVDARLGSFRRLSWILRGCSTWLLSWGRTLLSLFNSNQTESESHAPPKIKGTCGDCWVLCGTHNTKVIHFGVRLKVRARGL